MKERLGHIRDDARQELRGSVSVKGHDMPKANVVKFCGLVAFFVLVTVACVLAWPYIHGFFEPGARDLVVARVQDAGPVGALILLGFQFIQVVVAFIPGEVVQIAAGMLYGPWMGALVILVGCVIASSAVFVMVRRLGAPFVQAMVSSKYLTKFAEFERSGKLNAAVFILFLIPGMPKDVFTYLVPLTTMRMRTFLLLATVARIPGVVVSTYAADSLLSGDIARALMIFAIGAAIAVLGFLLREPILARFGRRGDGKGH